jgi:chromosome segregation ATPase
MVALAGAGLAVGLGYGHILLGREQQAHQTKVNELNRKVALVGKKASEEREALAGAEGRNRSLQAELDRLHKENDAQAEDMKKLQSEAQLLETKLKEMTEEAARMKSARDEVGAQLAQILQAAKELEGQAKVLAAGKQTLETSLAKVNQELDNCRSHNARLCLIANEMLSKEKSRGAFGSVLRGEPMTQIGQVELEKFMQEYKDKIDQEKVKNIQ